MKIPELLSPAGSFDALKAAVSAGADAVYLGGKSFGARAYASNFSEEEIVKAVEFAHSHGVKVYVTVNTLVTDDELPKVAEYLKFLSSADVDAILVQDTAVLMTARETVPDLPIHASTQMTIHNSAGIKFASEHGITRVVLAREVSIEDLAEIKKTADEYSVELEIFVHGAICYSYSGQCLFSSVIGGRSGNRGMCAQPCRKPYTLLADKAEVKTDGEYILSTRDMCLYPHLDKVCETGVDSIKIEGRMKTPEYVAIVTNAYRNALDDISKGEFNPDTQVMDDLSFAFTRGFTKGYLLGDKGKAFMNYTKPDNRGVFAGTVSGVDEKRGKVIVQIEGPVPDTGDGLVFKCAAREAMVSPHGFKIGGELGKEVGFALNKEPYVFPEGDAYKIPAPSDVTVGSELWITKRMQTERHASTIVSKETVGRVPIDVDVSINNENYLVLSGYGVSAKSEIPMMEALKKPVTSEAVETQVRKSGGTPFAIRNISMNYDGTKFVPIKIVSDLRRRFLDECLVKLTAKKERRSFDYQPKGSAKPDAVEPIIQVYTDSVVCAKAASTGGADQVVYEGFDEIYDLPIIYKLPRITAEHELEKFISKIPASASGVMVDGIGIADSVKGVSRYGGSGLNITNAVTANEYGKKCRQICLSPELSGKQIKTLMENLSAYSHPPKVEVIVQGSLEVMITENCIPATVQGCRSCNQSWALKDRTNRIFRIRTDSACRTHILNAAETCLLEYVNILSKNGVSVISIDARGRSPEYIRRMISIYREALDGGDLKALKEQIRELASGGITAGHYLRGTE